MNNKIKVTIIIPVYNGSEFLRRSFDSCIYQTMEEIEVIAVNDHSPNLRDAEIMQEYEACYPTKFRALFHDMNKRQGGARNTGIRAARGEYFLCVDQDDYISPDMCEKMYEKAKSENMDLCMCGYSVFCKGIITYHPPLLYDAETLNTHNPTVWKLLTKKSFITENDVFFPENVVTDDVVSILWFALTDRYCTLNEPFYNWMRHENAESFIVTHRFCQSLPTSFIMISKYMAYKNLSDEKKVWFNIVLTRHLYDSVMLCTRKYPDKIVEHFKLITETLNTYSLNFEHSIFSRTMYGKLAACSLQYIQKLSKDESAFSNFMAFHDKIKLEWIINRLSSLLSGKILSTEEGFPITIWGAGIRGERLAGYLSKINVLFEITDIDSARYGQTICGVVVKPWSELKYKSNLVIVSPLNAVDAVKRTINDDKIRIVDFKDLLNL